MNKVKELIGGRALLDVARLTCRGFRLWRTSVPTAALAVTALVLGMNNAKADTAVVDAGAHLSRLEDGTVKVSVRVSGNVVSSSSSCTDNQRHWQSWENHKTG